MQDMIDLRNANGQGCTDGVPFLRFHVELAEKYERCYAQEEVVCRTDRRVRDGEGYEVEVDFDAFEERVPDTLHWRDLRVKQDAAQNRHDRLDRNRNPDHHTLSGAELVWEPSADRVHLRLVNDDAQQKEGDTTLAKEEGNGCRSLANVLVEVGINELLSLKIPLMATKSNLRRMGAETDVTKEEDLAESVG
jgi:hypothetical protein